MNLDVILNERGFHLLTGKLGLPVRHLKIITFFVFLTFSPMIVQSSQESIPVVYQVYQGLDLGDEKGAPPKDYYVNIGSSKGVSKGTVLQVYRRAPSYDTLHEKILRDVTFPIAWLKVIHVESKSSVARLEKFLPQAEAPISLPQAVMVGDLIQIRSK